MTRVSYTVPSWRYTVVAVIVPRGDIGTSMMQLHGPGAEFTNVASRWTNATLRWISTWTLTEGVGVQ